MTEISRQTMLPMTSEEFQTVRQGGATILSFEHGAKPVSLFQVAFAAVRFDDGCIVVVDAWNDLTDEQIVERAEAVL